MACPCLLAAGTNLDSNDDDESDMPYRTLRTDNANATLRKQKAA
jgi:hypothetical protein